jgi:hypothetical protein
VASLGNKSDTAIDVSVLTVATVVYGIVFTISKSLILDTTDFKGFVLSSLHSREAGQWLPGATADFQRSLGISEYPVGLVFDFPWLLATSVPATYLQAVFAVSTCISLYVAINLMGYRIQVPPFQRQLAGFLLPLLMFIPGPVKWNSISIYTASFAWTVSVLTIALVALSTAPRWRRTAVIPMGLVAGMFVFWGNISYLPMTLPTVLIGAGFILCQSPDQKAKTKVAVFLVAMLSTALLVIPLFTGVYLFGVWSVPDIAVQENIDIISTWRDVIESLVLFPGLGKLPLISELIGNLFPRILAMLALLLAIFNSWRTGRRRAAILGLLSLGTFEIYALFYALCAKLLSRELGLTPSYIEIVAYPIWLLLIVHLFLGHQKLREGLPRAFLKLLPLAVVVLWGSQWVIRNNHLRSELAQFPILQSDTTRQLISLTSDDLQAGLFPRVIILQDRFPAERAPEGFRIRRASDFSYSFLLELQSANIPVLNAYSHMISPNTFAITHEAFTDGRPSWRQFSLYDRPNVDMFSDFGIRYVLSEFPVNEKGLRLLSAKPFKAYGLFPTDRLAYLYEVATQESLSASILKYEFKGNQLLVSGFSSERISVSVPIEFSRCLIVSSPTGSLDPIVQRRRNGLIDLTFQGNLDIRLHYENSIFQWRNCRILDYMDFRRQEPSS